VSAEPTRRPRSVLAPAGPDRPGREQPHGERQLPAGARGVAARVCSAPL